jgi:predicted Na+-dependent transporter
LAGIQEILTLLLIIIAIIFVPRIMPGGKRGAQTKRKALHFSGRIRIGITLSVMIPLAAALLLKPWHHNLIGFVSVGIAPVAAGWAIFWIVSGFKKPNRHQK